jgi:signal transduction histidine kinase
MISLGLLLALYMVGGVTALWCLERSTRQLSALVESHQIQSLREALAITGLRVETDLLAHLADHQHSIERRMENERRLNETVLRCGECHHVPAIQARLDEIRGTLQDYLSTAPQVFTAAGPQSADRAAGEALELSSKLTQQAIDTAEQAGKHLMVRSAQAASDVRSARLVLLGTLSAALVLGGVVAFHLKTRLTVPVEHLLAGIARIGGGDTAYRLSLVADQEFMILADAFNKAYEDLRSVQENMLRAEKLAAVGQLAAGVAHETLNPLASISSIAQLMRRRCQSDDLAKQINLIMEAIERASKVLRELLTFSRPMGVETQELVQIANLLERATSLVGYDRRAQGIAITCRCGPALRAIRGDSERLLFVFTNIIINALDAMKGCAQGAGALLITARQERGRVTVRFADDGTGMTNEQVTHAFEPFFTTKEPGAGTGLGLWICYQIIERHHGTIRIESLAGNGTTVVVELPCKAESVDG